MKILNARQIKEVDRCSIELQKISSWQLMERAAGTFVNRVLHLIQTDVIVHIYCGKGNNGGDGLAVARLLAEKGFCVNVFIVEHSNKSSEDFNINYEKIKQAKIPFLHIEKSDDLKRIDIPNKCVCIDAILGTGVNKPAQGIVKEVIQFINAKYKHQKIISIDVPSGIFLDFSNDKEDSIIRAHYTFTFQLPKFSFLLPENAVYTGKWEVLDIQLSPACIERQITNFYTIDYDTIVSWYRVRKDVSAKWDYGHCLIMAGSKNMRGAAVLCVGAALRSGCGLVSIHSIEKVVDVVINNYPECILSIDENGECIQTLPDLNKYNSIAFGCGVGVSPTSYKVLVGLLENSKDKKIIIDADGLNMMAQHKDYDLWREKQIIITPHIKEFDRLFGECLNHYERIQKGIRIANELKMVIVLKSAYTAVILPNQQVYFSIYPNSGLARGGSGDILTGIITSLCARGYNIEMAAILGVYVHSLAAHFAIQHIHPESVLPSDILHYLSKAFAHIHEGIH